MSEHQLAREIRAAQVLKAALLEVTDDPDALADTIEGATNLHEAIAKVMDGIGEDEILLAGIDVAQKALSGREMRLNARVNRRRSAIERAMSVGELTKLELPQATLSVRRLPPALIIDDETQIPAVFWVSQEPKLHKKALADVLKTGKPVPGAHLDNGGQTLSIRRA